MSVTWSSHPSSFRASSERQQLSAVEDDAFARVRLADQGAQRAEKLAVQRSSSRQVASSQDRVAQQRRTADLRHPRRASARGLTWRRHRRGRRRRPPHHPATPSARGYTSSRRRHALDWQRRAAHRRRRWSCSSGSLGCGQASRDRRRRVGIRSGRCSFRSNGVLGDEYPRWRRVSLRVTTAAQWSTSLETCLNLSPMRASSGDTVHGGRVEEMRSAPPSDLAPFAQGATVSRLAVALPCVSSQRIHHRQGYSYPCSRRSHHLLETRPR